MAARRNESPARTRLRANLRSALLLLAAYVAAGAWQRGSFRIVQVLGGALAPDGRGTDGLYRLLHWISTALGLSFGVALFVATIALPVGWLFRTIVRARVRAQLADPLERDRQRVARWPRLTGALAMAPGLLWTLVLVRIYPWRTLGSGWDALLPGLVLPAALALLAHASLARRAVKAFLAPTLEHGEAGGVKESADAFTFDAVAVTREAVGAVGGVALLTVAMMVHVVSSPIATLMRDPIFLGTLIGYIGIAGASAFLFQRVSRISIGLDGILIGGSSRTRFFGYRDVDAARERGGDIELLRGDRVVLRLQLHGKDASRREALLERLREAITRAENLRGDPDAGFVASASVEDLTRAADGAASYRQALPTRDKLWQLFESPAIDSAARKAAGEALASGGDAGERARLRIAAEHCADPDARVRLHELLDDAKLNAEDEPPVRGRAKLSTSR